MRDVIHSYAEMWCRYYGGCNNQVLLEPLPILASRARRLTPARLPIYSLVLGAMSAEATQPAGLVLPSHLTRVEGETNSDEKENSAEEGEKKVALGDGEQTDTAMQVEDDAAVEDEAPVEETPDHDIDTVESKGGEEADENVAPDAAGRVSEAEATADADGEKPTARAAEAAGPSVPVDIPVRPPISNSVADVRTYPGLPPHGLSEDEIAELFDAVQRMKSKSSNQNFVKHGWQCLYALRTSGSATRGDMCVIDPRDGQKIFSLVGMRRKLGLEEAMACSMV